MARCWMEKLDVSSDSLKRAVLDISMIIARWSELVNQLNGEYPSNRIIGIIVGEQMIVSILFVPLLYVLKLGCVGKR